MTRPPKVVFAGGGTGGHLFPGIAVAEKLRARYPSISILFAGSERDIEKSIVAEHGYEHFSLPTETSTSFRKAPLRVTRNLWRAYALSKKLLRERRPDCVIGLGGFASVPVALAARRLRIPIVLLEQNIVPGRATRLLARYANNICLSFPETIGPVAGRANAQMTGNPVRDRIAQLASNISDTKERAQTMLLILGGSQGAVHINDAMLLAIKRLAPSISNLKIVHQTGAQDAPRVREAYKSLNIEAIVEPFFADLTEFYRTASLAVSRAGATTLAELACAGCPAILIPYPHSVGDHQLANARWFAANKAAVVVEQLAEPTGTASPLLAELSTFRFEAGKLEPMSRAMRSLARPHAVQDVANCIAQYFR